MKNVFNISVLLTAFFLIIPSSIQAQTGDLKAKVNDLVLKHYMDGIQYVEANALGPEAVPHLLALLDAPDHKEYRVNIIVTLGFIESSDALAPLTAYLEQNHGEVDGHTYRALMSVPFAIGSIASKGDPVAMNYLVDRVYTPDDAPVKWSFRGKKINRRLAEQSIIGLSISGHAKARAALLKLKNEIELGKGPPEREGFIGNVRDGLKTIDRIKNEGRTRIFNPQR